MCVHISSPKGKLRVLYEVFPMAFLAEHAGGSASTGKGRCLEIQPKGCACRLRCSGTVTSQRTNGRDRSRPDVRYCGVVSLAASTSARRASWAARRTWPTSRRSTSSTGPPHEHLHFIFSRSLVFALHAGVWVTKRSGPLPRCRQRGPLPRTYIAGGSNAEQPKTQCAVHTAW